MSGDMHLLVGAVIALAVGVGVTRLFLQRQSPGWSPRRFALLSVLSALAGALLLLTLFPPAVFRPGGVLVVATEGAPAEVAHKAGETLVALPEAGPVEGAERTPDLATALRRHPDVGAIRVVGHGLEARDRLPSGRRITFTPPPAPVGLTDFTPPAPVPAGARFTAGGRIGAAPARVELVDPAGAVVDGADVKPNERFVLSGQTRVEGLALFTLRLTANGRTLDQIAVPVEARTDPRPVVLVLAGAPGAETRFLRRWAEDAGVDLRLQVDLGAGTAVGDPPIALTPTALAGVDLVVIDDRRWERLGAPQKATLSGAVDAGMGLLLRPEGPLSASVRRDWAGLNISLTGGGDVRPTTLPGPADKDRLELNRVDLAADGAQTSVLARDETGAALVAWRPRGRGRVGVWTITDSYVLALSGQGSEHGELWSGALTALSRPLRTTRPDILSPAFAGSRMTLCGVAEGAVVVEAGARQVPLLIDPAAGATACAGYWPQEAGWRLLRDRSGAETAFYIQPKNPSGALARAERRRTTLALAASPPAQAARSGEREPGSPWPWFAALLATLGALWWLERRHGADKSADAAQT